MPRAAHALSRAQRIRKRPDFVRIQDSPSRVTTRHLLLLLALHRDGTAAEAAARLGVVASRKVGPAVARNRAKRLVREAFRQNPDIFPAGLDVVIIVRPGTHRLPFAEIDAEVRGVKSLVHRRKAELVRRSAERAAPEEAAKRGPR